MKKNRGNLLKIAAGLCLVAGFMSSCQPGGPPPRKKMPGYLSDNDGIERSYPFQNKIAQSNEGFVLASESVDINTNGDSYACVLVPLPDASNDDQVMNLLATYKPIALPMLTQWAKQNRNGVVIDFRANPLQDGSREDYMVERNGVFSFPLVFKWDGYSTSRMASYVALLKDVSGIEVKKTGGFKQDW